MGRGNQRLRILEEGFTGRCPPCLLGHRRVTRRSASPKLHKSLGRSSSQPARRTDREMVEPRRITPARPISAPTNGWSRSCTSGTWPILVRWTEPGGASSPTISPPSRTRPGLSRSSRPPRAPRPHRRPPRPRLPRHRVLPSHCQLPRPSRPWPHQPRRLRPKSPLRRPLRPQVQLRPLRQAQLRPLRQAQLRPLRRTQLCFLPRPHPMTPRSAGCAAPRPAP
jgi:hypothetical protein